MDLSQQLDLIKRNANEIIPEVELEEKLKLGRPLRVKLGLDPTAPDLHLGHSVVLQKMRDFQDAGHVAVLIVGDFTSLIGDPSGRNSMRPILTREEIEENLKTYTDQAFRILDSDKTEIRRNSEWLMDFPFSHVLDLTGQYTIARMLERDDFDKRYKAGNPISMREFLYPLAQALDSVAILADIEIGGTDQKFNLLVGRDIQSHYYKLFRENLITEGAKIKEIPGRRPIFDWKLFLGKFNDSMERIFEKKEYSPQLVLTMPLLEGTDGVEKMSKSLGNYVGIAEAPNDMYGKLMSIPDTLIERYVRLLTRLNWGEIKDAHPMDQKKRLAHAIVRRYHDEQAADTAAEEFVRVVSNKEPPKEIPKASIDSENLENGKIWIVELLEIAKLVDTRSDARRLVKQGAVSLDGERVEDENAQVEPKAGMLIKAGKRKYAEIELIDS